MSLSLPIPNISTSYRRGGEWIHTPLRHFFSAQEKTLLVLLKGAWISDRQARFYDSNSLGFDETVISTVNDTFVLNEWAADLNLQRTLLLPDGNGFLASHLNCMVDYSNQGLGARAYPTEWLVHNNIITYLGYCRCR